MSRCKAHVTRMSRYQNSRDSDEPMQRLGGRTPRTGPYQPRLDAGMEMRFVGLHIVSYIQMQTGALLFLLHACLLNFINFAHLAS